MNGQAVRIVLFPRYTSLVAPSTGSLDYHSQPVNVRAYCKADLTGWKNSTLDLVLQGSVDMETWLDIGTVSADETTQPVTTFSPLDTEWVRVKATLDSSSDTGSLWVVGEFALRGV
jgi:hypothetical protein